VASNIDERIAKEREKLEQLKRQKRAQEAREKKRKDAINKDRWMKIGIIFETKFQAVSQLTPRRTKAENDIEFAPLTEFISILAGDMGIVNKLNDMLTTQKQNNPDV